MKRLTLYGAILALVNIAIVYRIFGLEFSAHVHTNEGTFIAISRVMAAHPGDWLWWPLWESGIPFQNTYLPFLHMVVALFSRLTHCSPASSFHAVSGLFYCLGPLAMFGMAVVLSGRAITSFFAALAYSVISPCVLLSPVLRQDVGGIWNLRRLHILSYYGESPQTAALAMLPIGIGLLYLALVRRRAGYSIAAGLVMSAVVLTNAIGAVTLAMAVVCLVCTVEVSSFRRNAVLVLIVVILSYAFISPWLPPSMLQAIRMNSPTVDGDYHYTQRSWLGLAGLGAVFAAAWWSMRRWAVRPHLQFFALFALLTSAVTLLGLGPHINLLPQPHRYQAGMDIALCLAVVFGIAAILDRAPARIRTAVIVAAVLLCARQIVHDVKFGRRLIRGIDITNTIEYKTAQWMDAHKKGQRAMISGSNSFLYNVFTDNPQLHGGHDPFTPNFLQRIVAFALYSDMNAGGHAAEYSILWLKAFGAQAITMSGAGGREYYKPYNHPHKFEGVLPVLWRDGEDVIYDIPSRTTSLAHVIPPSAVVPRPPVNGLDVDPLRAYVAALDDPAFAPATLAWHNLHAARIETIAHPGDRISIQTTYVPGWHASANGVTRTVSHDGLGFLLLDPACNGPCVIELHFDGGRELLLTRLLSGSAVLIALAFLIAGRKRTGNPPSLCRV